MVEREPKRTCARSVACAVAALLAAFASGCTTSNTSNAALTTATASTGPTIAFESIDGPPVGIFNRLVDTVSAEAQARNLAIASREGAANYRVRGYLAAQVIRGRTHISWVWDVYDDDRLRALRITGEEAGGRAGSDPWSAADDTMLRRIARASMDRLAVYLGNPGGPLEPEATTAIAASPEPETSTRPRQRRPRSAAAPSAAERLAMSAAR
ncbi:MAG: hypothetical protein QOF14_3972 [Hyphomicrobiales bacterium]|nr:hypothetical protein [Hyphomicrobiales bacterium]